MQELGILDEFLREVPHQTMEQLGIGFKGQTFDLIDFRRLPTACKYVVFMPQSDFLNFLADKAKRYPSFRLEMKHGGDRPAVGGRTGRGRDRPNRGRSSRDPRGCDGRLRRTVVGHPGTLRIAAYGVSDLDVLWFRLPRADSAPETLGYLGEGQIIIAINRGDYWQYGAVIDKGGFERVKAEGLPGFRSRVRPPRSLPPASRR